MDLILPHEISAVAIQGMVHEVFDIKEYVTSFAVEYTNEHGNWTSYTGYGETTKVKKLDM